MLPFRVVLGRQQTGSLGVPHYLGIDVGTSAVKAILVDDGQNAVAEADVPLTVSRPHDLWSEQDPEAWWQAVQRAVEQLRATNASAFADIRGIGLSGQMHGAVLLDENEPASSPGHSLERRPLLPGGAGARRQAPGSLACHGRDPHAGLHGAEAAVARAA